MHAEQASLYHRIWLKIEELAKYADKCLPKNLTPEAKTKAHEKFIASVAALDLQKIERENGISFKFWLIETYHHDPNNLIKNLFFLQWIRHPFHHAVSFEPNLIEHICQSPKAIEILHLVFATLHPYNFQITVQIPPYAMPSISDELFHYLIDNHDQYCQPNSPIFWAIQQNDLALLTKILNHKPEWVNIKNQFGDTPLMVAIRLQNEAGLLKLMEYSPNHMLGNQKNESIAHIACQSDQGEWLIKLIKDSRFEPLQISHMIADPNLKDNQGQIALCHAIYKGYISLAQSTLEFFPFLRVPLFNCYFRAIDGNNIEYLNIFFHDLNLDFSDNIYFQIALILHAVKQKTDDTLCWILHFPFINSELRKSALFLKQIENNQFSTLSEQFTSKAIDWTQVPNDICYKITTSLLAKNQSQLIIELNLFDITPYFHTYYHPKTHEKISFLNFVYDQKGMKLPRRFSQYFLEHMEKNPSRYTNWLYDFHDGFFKNLSLLDIDRNMLVHGEPLLHFYENYAHRHFPAKYLENLSEFISSSVQLNAKNQQHQHLFAKLITDQSHGFERIIMLKNSFPQFSLENLDARGSNLLHLAIENNHLTCIRWCLNQNIDPFSQRTTDGLSALQLILDSSNHEMFDILRKHIKKMNFLTFIGELITQQKDELIAYLFSHERPFSWEFKESHIQQLLKFSHDVITARFSRQPPPPVAVPEKAQLVSEAVEAPVVKKSKPRVFTLNHEILLNLIDTANIEKFEKLIDDEYQEILNGIFSEHFFDIIERIFHSECKRLNKAFIRIPAAHRYISETNAWHVLFTKALSTHDLILIENMISRESIREHLKENIIAHYETALHNNPAICHEVLFKHFPLGKEDQRLKLVLMSAVQTPNDALLLFLKDKSHRLMFSQLDKRFWFKFSEKELVTINACLEFIEIARHFEEHAPACYIEAIKEENIAVLNNLLSFPNIRQILKFLSPELLTDQFGLKVLPIWARYESELATVLNYALQIPNEDLLEFLKNIAHRLLLTQGDATFWYRFSQKEMTFLQDAFEYRSIEHKFLEHVPQIFINALQEDNEELLHNLLAFPPVRQKLKHAGPEYLQHLLNLGYREKIVSLWTRHHELSSCLRPYCPISFVMLPDFINAAFHNGFPAHNLIYLVGSAIHHLLNQTPFDTLHDIDFIGTRTPIIDIHTRQGVYMQSKVLPQLYFRTLFQRRSAFFRQDTVMSIEYYHQNIPESDNFIAQDHLNRDFTVNCLYCDAHGRIFDPTNMGIFDLERRVIRSIKDPLQSFLKDPIRILRAIRLMIKGFELSPEVKKAIEDWSATEAHMNYGHLYSMANSMLAPPNDNRVFQILMQLRLTERLLHYTGNLKLREFKSFVNDEAHRYKHAYLSTMAK
jgi:ankyrin repeat protein